MNIGTAVKTLRKEKNFGQKQLSEMCGISVNALSQIETNNSFPHKSTIDEIYKALEIPVSYLLFFSISDEDIPDNKKSVFHYLSGAMKSLLLDNKNLFQGTIP